VKRLALALQSGDKVYVAARFERQAEARDLAHALIANGFSVTSRWLTAPGLALGDPCLSELWGRRDLNDVDACDVYLLLSDEVLGRGGKDFEGGYAFARGKRLVVVGPRAHVFHFLPGVRHVRDIPTLRFLYLNGEKIDE
jgi:nucleoside 2-deoxyribosyltransferase